MFEKLPSEKEPMPASTLLLIRDKNGELQVYLLKRKGSSGFFPGNYVFPGGMVDSEDRDTDFWKARVDLEPEEIDRRLGGALGWEEALAFAVAAVRETFEEAGVLLAWKRRKSGHPFEGRPRHPFFFGSFYSWQCP
jgi:8-oxo-dGTP pyrophosphatase MutT (NUDIX family)